GEARLKDVRSGISIHALSGIAYGQHDVFTGLHFKMATGELLVEFYLGGLDRHLSTLCHCVTRIDYQINQDLLNLCRVAFHLAQIRLQDRNDVDVGWDEATQKLMRLPNGSIEIQYTGFDYLLPAESEQLAGQ